MAREAIAAGDADSAPARAEQLRRALLQPVINATGVLLHTNLGRAPLAAAPPAPATNLELDLATGQRGSRQDHCGRLVARLCGAERAIVVNNNAVRGAARARRPGRGAGRWWSAGARASRSAAASGCRR